MTRRVAIAAAAFVVCTAAVAFTADSAVVLRGRDGKKKVGRAEVRWNPVPYREELMAQLAPGLTWRLGKDGPTRLAVEGVALVAPGGVLLPGEMTLNLRFWEERRWELVVFEEKDWKWSEDKNVFAEIPAHVGTQPASTDAPHAKRLELSLHVVPKDAASPVARPAVTGGPEADGDGGSLLDDFEVPDDVEYPPALRKRWAALPALELRMAYGPHVGAVRFETVPVKRLAGNLSPPIEGGKPLKLVADVLELPDAAVRAHFLEEHEGEIPLMVIHEGGPKGPNGGRPRALVSMSGGDVPYLWVRDRLGKEEHAVVLGEAGPARTKKMPSAVTTALDGDVLSVRVHDRVYRFTLWDVEED